MSPQQVTEVTGASPLKSPQLKYIAPELSARTAGYVTMSRSELMYGHISGREGRETVKPSIESLTTYEDILYNAFEFASMMPPGTSPIHEQVWNTFHTAYPQDSFQKSDEMMVHIKEFLNDPDHKAERVLLAMRLAQWQQATLQMGTHITLDLVNQMSSDKLIDRDKVYRVGRLGGSGIRSVDEVVDVSVITRIKRGIKMSTHTLLADSFGLESSKRARARLQEERTQQQHAFNVRKAERRPYNEYMVKHSDHLKTRQNGQDMWKLDFSRLTPAQKAWMKHHFGDKMQLNIAEITAARNEIIYAADARVELIQDASKRTRNNIDPNMARPVSGSMAYVEEQAPRFFKGDKPHVRFQNPLEDLENTLIGGTDNAVSRLRAQIEERSKKVSEEKAIERIAPVVASYKNASSEVMTEEQKTKKKEEIQKDISKIEADQQVCTNLKTKLNELKSKREERINLSSASDTNLDTLVSKLRVYVIKKQERNSKKQFYDDLQGQYNAHMVAGRVTEAAALGPAITIVGNEVNTANNDLNTAYNDPGNLSDTWTSIFPSVSSEAELEAKVKAYTALKDEIAKKEREVQAAYEQLKNIKNARGMPSGSGLNHTTVNIVISTGLEIDTRLNELEVDTNSLKSKHEARTKDKEDVGKPDVWVNRQKDHYELYEKFFITKEGDASGYTRMQERIMQLDRGEVKQLVIESPPGTYILNPEIPIDSRLLQNDNGVGYPLYYLHLVQVMFGADILLAQRRDDFFKITRLLPVTEVHRRLGTINGRPSNDHDSWRYWSGVVQPSDWNKRMCDQLSADRIRTFIKSIENDAVRGHLLTYERDYREKYAKIKTASTSAHGISDNQIRTLARRYHSYEDIHDLAIQINEDPDHTTGRGCGLNTAYDINTPADCAALKAIAKAVDEERRKI